MTYVLKDDDDEFQVFGKNSNQNLIYEELNSRLNSRNACY
jgi:hypothetical protein